MKKRIRLTKEEMKLIDIRDSTKAVYTMSKRTGLTKHLCFRIVRNYRYGGYKSMTIDTIE